MRTGGLISAGLATVFVLSACGKTDAPTADAPAGAAVTPAIAAPSLTDLPSPYNEANLANGGMVFAKCKNCHGLLAKEGNKVGPNLHGVFDRPPASVPKFKYSPALSTFQEERWTPDLIDHWLANPGTFLPGNGMFFNGIGKPADRRDVIAYLLIETRK